MSSLTTKLIIIFFSFCVAYSQAQTCHALVLQSGGDLGAYEAGVFYGLVNNLAAADVAYDVVTGVSVGAMNTVGIGQFAIGQEIAAANFLVGMWNSVNKDAVYQTYAGGLLQGLLFEPSIYDTSPLQSFLTAHLTSPMQRKINIGATDVNLATMTIFQENLSVPELVQAAMCSSAVPMLFPYQTFQGSTYMDGGVITSMDVEGAVTRCLEVVTDPADIIIDIIMTQQQGVNPWPPSPNEKPLDSLIRMETLVDYQNAIREITTVRGLYPNATLRYIIQPSIPLPDSLFPFQFDQADTDYMIAQGILDAKNAIQNREKVNSQFFQHAYTKLLGKYGIEATEENIQKHHQRIRNQKDLYETLFADN